MLKQLLKIDDRRYIIFLNLVLMFSKLFFGTKMAQTNESFFDAVTKTTITVLVKQHLTGDRFLDGQTPKYLTLAKKENITHNTRRFTFSLENDKQVLGLPVAGHIRFFGPKQFGAVEGQWNGAENEDEDEIYRMYSPVSDPDMLGKCELVIKVYKKGVVPSFPDGGKFSQYLDSLKIGDKVKALGPFGYNYYLGKGKFIRLNKEIEGTKVNFGLIAAGSGITPLYNLTKHLLTNPDESNTTVSLIYANISENDILIRDEIDALQKKYPSRFKVYYVLDNPPENSVTYGKGYVTAEMIKEHLPGPADDTIILHCGPPKFNENCCVKNLELLGYAPNQRLKY